MQKGSSIVTDNAQLSTNRLYQSITATRYTNPCAIRMYVMSVLHEPLRHPNVRDVRAPHLVDAIHFHPLQQIRIDLVSVTWLAQLRLRIHGGDSDPLHQAHHPLG